MEYIYWSDYLKEGKGKTKTTYACIPVSFMKQYKQALKQDKVLGIILDDEEPIIGFITTKILKP